MSAPLPNSSSPSVQRASPWQHWPRVCWRAVRQTVKLSLKLLLAVYFVFALLILVLRYAVLPNISNYQADLQNAVSHALGRQLEIGQLQASWQGINPKLELSQVQLRDQAGQVALTLPRVEATLSWSSLFFFAPRFHYIEIQQARLQLGRNPQGLFVVGGFVIDPEKKGDGQGLDWLLAQKQVRIRDAEILWRDQHLNLPEQRLTQVNFLLHNHWLHHQFALKAVPQTELAAPLDLRGDFRQPLLSRQASDFSQWSGQLYAQLRQANLPLLQRYLDYPLVLQSGRGSLKAWLQIDKKRVADFTADVQLHDVMGRLRRDLPALDMAQVSGRLIVSEQANTGKKYLPSIFGQVGHSLALVNFSMQARDGTSLPAMTLRETFTPGVKGEAEKVEVFVSALDLQTLAGLAEHLPLPKDQRQMLLDFEPRGQLKNFTARWQGSYPDIASYQIKGEFSKLSLRAQAAQLARAKTASNPARAAIPAIPGFENLSGNIDASERGGRFVLDSDNLAFRLPSYFVDPLMPFQRLKMQAAWQITNQDQLLFQVQQMEAHQDGMVAHLNGRHSMSMRAASEGDFGEVELNGQIQGFDLKNLSRYIPSITEPHLRHWLVNGIQAGLANDVVVKIKGEVAQIPFSGNEKKRGKNEFLVKGKLAKARLDFSAGELAADGKSPLWPVIDEIDGQFSFERARMEILADKAKTLGADLSKVSAIIPDLLQHDPQLQIDGQASGALQTMLNYVAASPVDGWLGHFLRDSKGSNPASLVLKLAIPLNHVEATRVNGVVQFANNEVQLLAGMPVVSGLNGKLEFSETGVALGNLRGSFLGGAVSIGGGSQKDGSIKVKVDGTFSADGLRRVMPPTLAQSLGQRLSGAARYNSTILVRKRTLEIQVDSNLQGLASSLPEPFSKLGSDYLPLHFELLPQASDSNRDEIRVNLGTFANARYQRERTAGNANWQVLKAGIAINQALPEPEQGLALAIELPLLNIEAWQSVLDRPANAGTNTASSANEALEFDLASYLQPQSVNIKTPALQFMGKQLQHVEMQLQRQNQAWQVQLNSDQVAGKIEYGAQDQSSAYITARLSKLIIPKSVEHEVGDLLEGKNSNTQLPGLDIQAENFELFGKKLGTLELQAHNQFANNSREWTIRQLSIKNPDGELRAQGKWSSRKNESTTQLAYLLTLQDAGKLLERFGFAHVLAGGKGKLEGEVSWNGAPTSFDIPSMRGKVQLVMAAGQFLKVDPGAAKLLGVLSMQAIPRRLTLDFRDVFSEGFAFDSIAGTANLQNGVAHTDNLKMLGVNATVLIAGEANLVKENQDLHVTVIPVVNVGAASVVYGLAVNPVIGLGTFLAQVFLKEPLAKAFTFEYQVNGSWYEPNVIKLERQDKKTPARLASP